VQHVNWESIFYINVPVGVIALVMSLTVLRETPPSRAARSFDVPGILLLSVTLFLLIWGLIKGPGYGWTDSRTLAFFGGAVLGALLFVLREWRTKEPLLPLRLFRSVPLSAGTVLVLALMFSLFGAMFFMTFYLENVRGLDAVATGVRLLPMTGMMIVGAPLSGALITRIGPRIPMVTGMLMGAAGLYGLSRVGVASGLGDTIIWFVLLGLGLSPVIVGATDVIVGNAAAELAGVAGGLQSTAMQVGGTLGTAVLGAVMSARVSSLLPGRWAAAHLPPLTGAQLGQLKSAVTVGVAPVPRGTPPQIAARLAEVSHSTFVSGMNAAFVVAAFIAVGGAAVGLLTRRGRPTADAVTAAGPGTEPGAAPETAVAVSQPAAADATAAPDLAPPPAAEAAPAPLPAPTAAPQPPAVPPAPAAVPLPAAGAVADGHGALTGMVRDGRGAPVAAAAVTIIDGTGAQVAREVTAGDGRYHIGGVRPGVYTALVTAADHHPAASMVAFGAPQTRSDFDLSPAPGPA
jgi:predicted MFS family arabinose efflux permease